MNKGALSGIGRDDRLLADHILRFELNDSTGTTLTTGAKARYQSVPYDLAVVAWRLFGNVTGSLVIDIWADRAANFPPTAADSIIVAGAKPTLTNTTYAESLDPRGWRGDLDAGDILELNLDSVTTTVRAVLELMAVRR